MRIQVGTDISMSPLASGAGGEHWLPDQDQVPPCREGWMPQNDHNMGRSWFNGD